LRDVYKMDPEIIQKVDEEYGPFDWRLPDAHAVYWAELYRQKADPTANLSRTSRTRPTDDTDTLRRSIFQSLRMALLRGGALSPSVTNVTEQNFMLWPNLDLVPKISAAYEKMIAEQPNLNFQNAHKNFLKEAIPLLYINGRIKQAAYWFDYHEKNLHQRVRIKAGEHFAAGLRHRHRHRRRQRNGPEPGHGQSGGHVHGIQCLMTKTTTTEADQLRPVGQGCLEPLQRKIGARCRLRLKPAPEIKQRVLDEMLDPKAGMLDPYYQNYLRTKLGLKSPPRPSLAPEAAPPAPSTLRDQ
jgi:hypothetical protein